jgi:hypothetical protein
MQRENERGTAAFVPPPTPPPATPRAIARPTTMRRGRLNKPPECEGAVVVE